MPSKAPRLARACVTGGAGFIGSHLVDRLVRDGVSVVVLDDLSTGSRANLEGSAGRVELVEGDVRRRADVDRAVRGADVVFHLAALTSVPGSVAEPLAYADVNVVGTLNVALAAAAARARRLVFASSSSVYGESPALPKREDMTLEPCSPYAATKAAGEDLLSSCRASYGIETVCLRFFNVYGPRQSETSPYAAAVPKFVGAMLSGRTPVVYGDGGQTRDFTYVEDVVDACVRAASVPGAAGSVNVGAGRPVSVNELLAVVAEVVGWRGAPSHEPPRPGDVRDSVASVDLARERLGWTPRTPLSEGLARTAAAAREALRAAGA